MKKILLLFSAVGMLSLTGCNNDDYDEDTIAEVFETPSLTFTAAGNYKVGLTLNPQLLPADMVLVYRLTFDPNIPNTDVWELIPRTLYINNGTDILDEIDYDYNFTQQDILFRMTSNTDLAIYPQFTQNQIFRVVIIPGYRSDLRVSADGLNEFEDYNATIAKYGIKENTIKKL